MPGQSRAVDVSSKLLTEAILKLGARQNGTVSRRQLLAAGLSDGGIRHRNENGMLFRIYRGAYSVSGRHVDQKGIWMAGVLAAGEGSALSHMSAADAWGFGSSGRPRSPADRVGVAARRSGLRPADGRWARPSRAGQREFPR